MLGLVEIALWAIAVTLALAISLAIGIGIALALVASTESERTITLNNNCAESMSTKAFPDTKNPYNAPLNEVTEPLATVNVNSGDTKAIEINKNDWGGGYVPFDTNGENCKAGGGYTTNFDGKAFTYLKNGNSQIRSYFSALPNVNVYRKCSVYSIDISSEFYTSVNIVPTATVSTNCRPVEFSGFACTPNEKLDDVCFPSTTLSNISLAIANMQQCTFPCNKMYWTDGRTYKYDSTSAPYGTYNKKNVAYKFAPENYCCTVGETQCNLSDTEYCKGLPSAGGKAATVGPYYSETTDYCYNSPTATNEVKILCRSSNSAPANTPGCG